MKRCARLHRRRRGRAAWPAAPRPGRSRSGPGAPEHGRAARRARARPAAARPSSRPGTPPLPPRWLGPATGGRRSSGWRSADPRSCQADGVGQQCYRSSWRIAPSGGSGGSHPPRYPPLSQRQSPSFAIAPFGGSRGIARYATSFPPAHAGAARKPPLPLTATSPPRSPGPVRSTRSIVHGKRGASSVAHSWPAFRAVPDQSVAAPSHPPSNPLPARRPSRVEGDQPDTRVLLGSNLYRWSTGPRSWVPGVRPPALLSADQAKPALPRLLPVERQPRVFQQGVAVIERWRPSTMAVRCGSGRPAASRVT